MTNYSSCASRHQKSRGWRCEKKANRDLDKMALSLFRNATIRIFLSPVNSLPTGRYRSSGIFAFAVLVGSDFSDSMGIPKRESFVVSVGGFMARAYSQDLRDRALDLALARTPTRHTAARFGVGIATRSAGFDKRARPARVPRPAEALEA